MRKNWGSYKGKDVFLYQLTNEYLKVEISNYGGIIKAIYTQDKNGIWQNVVLGFDTLEEYIKYSPYFGAIVGRNAGRIANATLNIDGKIYKLTQNNGKHNLHGGEDNLSHNVWDGREYSDNNKKILELKIMSHDKTDGFPADVSVNVKYILENNTLTIKYYAESNGKTLVNLTNHSYFNLSGDMQRDIKDEYLTLSGNEYVAVDSDILPVKIKDSSNTIFDMTSPVRLGEIIDSNHPDVKIVGNGLDHPFITKNLTLYDKISGRQLKVSTDQNVMVLYSGNFLHEVGGKKKFKKYDGLAIEAQNYPDPMNIKKLREINENQFFIEKYKPYHQTTKYTFDIV